MFSCNILGSRNTNFPLLFFCLFFSSLAEPLWPVLDIWLAEAKDSSNSTMLKQLLKVLSMLPVSFALLVGGRQIPKLVRKLAKKWPNGDVRVMAAELFAKYTALIEENTNGEATASAQQSSSSKSRVAAESDANKKFINSFTDGAEVEDWENEWKVYKAFDDETPAQIAKKKKVSLIDLLKINVWRLEGLAPSSRLEEGTDILVPLDGPNDPKKAKKRMRPNISDEPPSRTNAKRVRSNSDSSAASAKRSSASSASASSATAPAKRPVAISPPARTPGSAKSGSAKSPTEPSQKKIVKQLVPQVRKLSSSGRSGSFGAALGTSILWACAQYMLLDVLFLLITTPFSFCLSLAFFLSLFSSSGTFSNCLSPFLPRISLFFQTVSPF